LDIDLVSIRRIFHTEATKYEKTVWMSVIGMDGDNPMVVPHFHNNQRSEKSKSASTKMAKTARNIRTPSGFEYQNGLLLRIYISPLPSNCHKHLTVALGGLPIFQSRSRCIGGIGISGLKEFENVELATTILSQTKFYQYRTWKTAFESANLIHT
jgi:uncharacterized protein GlcG (DUF336 family)